MNELEERMFRLSEALRGLEPENASRLRLALQFSREEQILEQMRETHKLLKEAQLSKAETEVKELIAKLSTFETCCWPRIWTSSSSWRGSARCANARPARTDHRRREARARLVPLRARAAQAARAVQHPQARPGSLVRDQQAVLADTKKRRRRR